MLKKKKKPNFERLNKVVAEAKQSQELREQGYREQALKLYPWICGRCSREFSNSNIRELTVHHRDHNHDNNPSNGNNWELLCVYCHDNEHSRHLEETQHGSGITSEDKGSTATHNPFAGLGDLLKKQ